MSMEEILITDANIFFDLLSVDLLPEFFLLPHKIKTTEFVLNEIKDEQQRAIIDKYIANGRLEICVFAPEQFAEIFNLKTSLTGHLSFEDCSVLFCAKQSDKSTVLTGDLSLRKNVEAMGLKVKGIIGVIDMMVTNHITHSEIAALRLEKLMSINIRLPKGSCRETIRRWKSK